MILTKKLTAALLSILIAIAFMPSMTFASGGGGTGTVIDPENATIEGDGSYIVDSDGFTGDIVVRSGNVDITLNGELRGTITVEKDAAATLDLNGNNITTTDTDTDKGNISIFNAGTLSVKGTGTVSSDYGTLVNLQGASCELNGGKFTSKSWYPIKNMGVMTINDGVTVTQSTKDNVSSLIDNGWYSISGDTINGMKYIYDSSLQGPKLTINGGYFTLASTDGTDSANNNKPIKNDDFGVMVINGGTLDMGTTNFTVNSFNDLTITGGTFKSAVPIYSYHDPDVPSESGNLKIEGGNFQSTYKTTIGIIYTKDSPSTDNIAVTGGTFNLPVSDYVSEDVPQAKVTDENNEVTYAVGQETVKKAAEDSNNTVTITSGSITLDGTNATITNNSEGTVTVDGKILKNGESVKTNTEQTIAGLKEQIASLQSDLSAAQSKSTEDAATIADLNDQLADAQAQATTDAATIADLKDQLAKAQADATINKATISALEEQLAKAQADAEANANTIADLNSQLTAARAVAATNADTINSLSSQLAQAKSDAKTLEDTLNAKITSLQSQLADAKTNADTDAATIADLNDQLTKAKAELDAVQNDLNNQISSLEAQLAEAKTNADADAKTIGDLNDRITSLQSALTEAQNKSKADAETISDLNKKLTDAQAKATTDAATIADLKDQLAKAQSDAATNTATITDLRNQLATAQAAAEANANTIADLNSQLTAARAVAATNADTINSLSSQLAQAKSDAKTLEDTLNAKITSLQSQLADAKTNADTDAATIKDLNDQLTAANEELKTLKENVSSLEAQLDEARKASETAEATIAGLNDKLAQTQADLQQAQEDLKAAQQSAATFAPVAQVTNLKAVGDKASVTLTWSALTSNASGYKIYRKTGTGSYKLVKTISGISTAKWTNTRLKKGKTYYYRIKAYKAISGGELWGAYSTAAKAKTTWVARVKNLKAAPGRGKVTLTWRALRSDVSGYKIYRKTAGGTYKAVKTIKKPRTARWTNYKLKKGRTYYFYIKAYRTVKTKRHYGNASTAVHTVVK